MADLAILRESPLVHLHERMRAGHDRPVALRETAFLTMASVRVRPGSAAARRIGEVLGGPLPTACGETTAAGGRTALWLGPDEWLVVSSADEPAALTAALHEALGGDPGSIVDVSANRTVLELSGARARAVLEKGCPVDLHPRRFTPGRAVTTTVGPVPVVLWQTAATAYRLLPRSSFADYLARWLLDAMAEYTAPGEP
ncbi:sarcosine oxidase subunit gamma family protein [Planosporangium thailandense]|uniref:Sarcosine oxidase subunit gamma family protein n=1 Tax=Planosporangium thailandense TaxID=765197 RepID=A0ABX0XZ38_9ACTN|nr:sarcosine oxidase subunit gamma family protein [Planosporangium thailandense]NJC71327.1 sarcosine oxidase subunit gamma family protein [Planosporangium thailandense]